MAKKRKLDEHSDSCDQSNAINGLDVESNIENKLTHKDGIITLNIGGIKYQTTILTICSNSKCIFAKMFGGKYSLKASDDKSYFIDRNGEHFRYILDYLRTNQLIIPKSDYLLKHLYVESEYYQLSSLKTSILLQKFESNILTAKNMAYIQKWFHQYHVNDNLNLINGRLVFEGKNLTFNENGGIGEIKVSDSLLFVFRSERHSFGFYLCDNRPGNDGFSFWLENESCWIRPQEYKHLLDHHYYDIPLNDWFVDICKFNRSIVYHIPLNFEENIPNKEPNLESENAIEMNIKFNKDENVTTVSTNGYNAEYWKEVKSNLSLPCDEEIIRIEIFQIKKH